MKQHTQKISRITRNIGTLLICGLLLATPSPLLTQASGLPTEAPQRVAHITVSYVTYEWWLLSWQNSQVICQIYVEHESWPDASEVLYYCGRQVQQQWLQTKPCVFDDKITSTAQCGGFYLHQVSAAPGQREIEVTLPAPEVWVSISDCNLVLPENRCSTLPKLHLEGHEPLPNEGIISIQGFINSTPFSCPGTTCDLPLPPTGPNGILVEFWADSSFGDSSQKYQAQVRLIPWGDFTDPENNAQDATLYYVDVISSQWMGNRVSTCSNIWSAFAPAGGPPTWLTSPENVQDLISTQPYYYLAGSLIIQGLVDASICENGGIAEKGAANQCGLELARSLVNEWQNQFDSEILRIANETGVPAQLMKNIFSRESQFWPGIYDKVSEAGLGHLSELGADAVLLWNPSFFTQFCPLVLSTEACQRGFGNLDLAEQEMLRGALVQKVNAACSDCPMGIDLAQANFSISIFARSLLANCEQVGHILYNTTGKTAGEVAGYEDLWRFTMVNYNAGSGCLINAIQRTLSLRQDLVWANVASHMEPLCQASIGYIDDLANMPAPSSVLSTTDPETIQTTIPTSIPTNQPTLQTTPIPTQTMQPTATQPVYPIVTQTQSPTQEPYP